MDNGGSTWRCRGSNGGVEAHIGTAEGLKAISCRLASFWWGAGSGSASKAKVGSTLHWYRNRGRSDPLHWYRNRGRLWCPPNSKILQPFIGVGTVTFLTHTSGRLNSRESGKLSCTYRTGTVCHRLCFEFTESPFYCTERCAGSRVGFPPIPELDKFTYEKSGKVRSFMCGKESTKYLQWSGKALRTKRAAIQNSDWSKSRLKSR